MTSQISDGARSRFLNLLAIIHRDGGQYTADHGLEQSCADAEIAIYRLSRMRSFCMDLDEMLEMNNDALTIGEWVSAYWTIANMHEHLGMIRK